MKRYFVALGHREENVEDLRQRVSVNGQLRNSALAILKRSVAKLGKKR